MSKHKKKKTNVTSPQFKVRDYVITGATIKDGKCDYSYRITEGTGIGDTHNVKGVGIHEDDLSKAFAKLNAHIACIDDAFKNANEEVMKITGKIHNHELTALYGVTGINIKGDENESIVMSSTKQISCSGEYMQIKTPKIPIDNLSSYKHWEDLKEVTDLVREEVALYKEGKCTNPEPIEDENQLTIGDEIEETDDELENGKV
jgi:hypothetical protein